MQRQLLSVLLLCCALTLARTAAADLLYYDPFNYDPPGTELSTAGSPNWAKNGGTSSAPTVEAGGLTHPTLLTSPTDRTAQINGSGIAPSPAANVTHVLDAPITTGSVYYSLLIKVPQVQTVVGTASGNGFATAGNLTSGSFIAGLYTATSTATAPTVATSAAPLLIRSGDQSSQFAATYQLGTAKTATASERQWDTSHNFTTGASAETVFVVLKYTFDSVNGDSADLYVNPTPGQPEPGASDLHVTAGVSVTLNNGISQFFLRNNSVAPDQTLLDELRVGTDWANVTPIPEPASLTIVAVIGGFLTRRRRRASS